MSGYLPKSSTRRKSRFLFVIETARALTLVGETGWPQIVKNEDATPFVLRFYYTSFVRRSAFLVHVYFLRSLFRKVEM